MRRVTTTWPMCPLTSMACFALLFAGLLACGDHGWPAEALAATLYPDMFASRPSPDPGVPSGTDPFTPPVDASSAPAGAPAIAEWTRRGSPGDSLVLTGDGLSSHTGSDFGKDSRFILYGRNANSSAVADALVDRIADDNLRASIRLSPNLPAGGMYLLWPQNSAGTGSPVAVNQTEAWWVGPDAATRNDSIAVYGRNLTKNDGTSPGDTAVYIKPAGSPGVWATVTAANPYKVTFTVPASLGNGTYEVWAHNKMGGHYGWSKAPASLTVTDGVSWTGYTYDVMTYGATGDDASDDTAAIQAAIDAAGSNYSTVHFPAGTYRISGNLTLRSNIRLLGAGRTNTTILAMGASLTKMMAMAGSPQKIAIRDMTLDLGTTNSSYAVHGTPSHLWLTDLDLRGSPSTSSLPAYLGPGHHIFLSGVNVFGGTFRLRNTRQVFIDASNFHGMSDDQIIQSLQGISDFAVANSTGQDYDNTTDTGWSMGPFIKMLNGTRAQRNFYFGNNTTHDLGVRPGYVDQNWGEQFSWEENNSQFKSGVISATSHTITLSATPGSYNEVDAVIMSGKGTGQVRRVSSINGDTLTLEPPLNVVPDASSTVVLIYDARNIAIYQNHLDGKAMHVMSNTTASNGIQAYGGIFQLVADGNVISDVRRGIYVVGRAERAVTPPADPAWFFQPSYFHLYVNNTLTNTRYGVWFGGDNNYGDPSPGTYLSGIVFRRNDFQGAASAAFYHNAPDNTSHVARWTDMNVFEQNAMTHVPVGIELTAGSGEAEWLGNLLVLRNTADCGAADYAGSKGISFEAATQLVGLRGNTWQRFETVYAGAGPGPVLERPQRVVRVSAAAGGPSVSGLLELWNAGTSSLSWTADGNASWLTLSASSGTLVNESSSAPLTLTCDPGGLSAGTHTADISITISGLLRKATVVFTVFEQPPGPNEPPKPSPLRNLSRPGPNEPPKLRPPRKLSIAGG